MSVPASLPTMRAWNWRRQLETGAASTIQDIADAAKISDRYISRMLRLAFLSPEVLEHLLIRRVPPALSLNDLAAVADRPWAEQMEAVFENSPLRATSGLARAGRR